VLKLLLDENQSPHNALVLRAQGFDVVHVRERGLLEAADAVVLARAFAEDRAVVTANVGDFRKLVAATEVHAGIVALPGGLLREEQLELLRRLISTLGTNPDLVNRVLSVSLDGGITLEEVPAP
jgi:predicted nuclease of predicted toxin-antitoxin system